MNRLFICKTALQLVSCLNILDAELDKSTVEGGGQK